MSTNIEEMNTVRSINIRIAAIENRDKSK